MLLYFYTWIRYHCDFTWSTCTWDIYNEKEHWMEKKSALLLRNIGRHSSIYNPIQYVCKCIICFPNLAVHSTASDYTKNGILDDVLTFSDSITPFLHTSHSWHHITILRVCELRSNSGLQLLPLPSFLSLPIYFTIPWVHISLFHLQRCELSCSYELLLQCSFYSVSLTYEQNFRFVTVLLLYHFMLQVIWLD